MTLVLDSAEGDAVRARGPQSWLLPALFTLAAFSGAALLFVVQPMVARLLLPSYGGSATVWSTSSLFFQVLLLLGYVYAHASTRRLGRWQPRVHLFALAIPILLLPVALPGNAAPAEDASAALWLLRTLAIMIGLPFVVVATTGPLLQKWYSWTDSRRAQDPYFLFAASNLGSFGGLLAYPFLIEPTLSLEQQQRWWSAGFVLYLLLTGACAVVASTRRSPLAHEHPSESLRALPTARILRWTWWAFLPSALMLAVTAHITTDVAAIPLLWVVPLALYLATFVIAFTRSSRSAPVTLTRVAVGTTLVACASAAVPGLGGSVLWEMAAGLTMLTTVAFAAHARLAADRPDPAHLTGFYIVVAVGGALGGVLNGLAAPAMFDRVLEYPLALVTIPLLMLGLPLATSRLDRVAERPLLWPTLLIGLAAVGGGGAYLAWEGSGAVSAYSWMALFALTGILGFRFASSAKKLTAVLAVLLGAPLLIHDLQSVDQSRTFFGSYRVQETEDQRLLVHGRTVHGSQFQDERSNEPTTYYARSGPLGAVFDLAEPDRVGVVGLGAGTVAAYGESGMRMTYFEIDPEVVRIAEDERLFTYLADTQAAVDTIVGDGRLKVAEQPARSYDLLVLDAFSSDAIPAHLLTVEAMRTYTSRLADDGLLAVHISNKVFDLKPVLQGAANELGWHGTVGLGQSGSGASATEWVVLSDSAERMAALRDNAGWEALDVAPVTWTDDFSSILNVLR